MPLTPQEKQGLSHLLHLLVEADEPETMLACLRHVAERKAFSVVQGRIERGEAARWTALADALGAAGEALKKAAPRAA